MTRPAACVKLAKALAIGKEMLAAHYRLVEPREEMCQPCSLQERGNEKGTFGIFIRSLKKMWLGNIFAGRIFCLFEIVVEQALLNCCYVTVGYFLTISDKCVSISTQYEASMRTTLKVVDTDNRYRYRLI